MHYVNAFIFYPIFFGWVYGLIQPKSGKRLFGVRVNAVVSGRSHCCVGDCTDERDAIGVDVLCALPVS